jgi:hypothetical protein
MAAIDNVLGILDMIIFILKWFWWAILALMIFIMKMANKAWPVDAVIIEKRGSNLIKTNDRAGRFVDPFTGVTGYKLEKSKDTIPILNYDWVMHNVNIPNSLFERAIAFLRGNAGTIFLFRYGSKQYKPIKIKESKEGEDFKIVYQPIKNDKGEDVYIQVYQPLDPRDKMGALNFEVVDWDNMNFMVQEMRTSIERRKKNGDWIKTIAVPLAIIGATVIFSIIMIKFGFDYSMELKSSAPTQQPVQNQPATPPNIPVVSSLLPG